MRRTKQKFDGVFDAAVLVVLLVLAVSVKVAPTSQTVENESVPVRAGLAGATEPPLPDVPAVALEALERVEAALEAAEREAPERTATPCPRREQLTQT